MSVTLHFYLPDSHIASYAMTNTELMMLLHLYLSGSLFTSHPPGQQDLSDSALVIYQEAWSHPVPWSTKSD